MLRSDDLSELEMDLDKVEQCLKSLQADDTRSPSERELQRMYYTHWQKRLRLCLAKGGGTSDQFPDEVEQDAQSSLNEVKPVDDSWKVITPPPLLRGVKNIRKDFGALCDVQLNYFRKKCFKDLHLLPSGTTEPTVFKNYSYACIGKLQEIVKYAFGRFLEISLNQSGPIGAAPIDWAFLQTVDLIEGEDRTVERWITSVCDKIEDIVPDADHEFLEKIVFRTDWRAPGWLYMQPNGNTKYEASAAWERRNETDTRRALRQLRENRWILSLKSTLKDLVDTTHEILAKRKISPESEPQSRTQTPAPTAVKGNQRRESLTKPLMLRYRSGVKRAILGALTKNPTATDAEVCRFLDADGGEELPRGWRNQKEDRSFFAAYRNPRTKRKIEIAISKIRRDLRDRGLLN